MTVFQRSARPNLTSVAFAAWHENQLGPAPAPVGLMNASLVTRWLRELGRPLTEMARRACRVGPMGGGVVILVAGTERKAGCSSVALALAAASATERSTMLLDGDMARPGLSSLLGPTAGAGWETLAPSRAPLGAFRHPHKHRLLSFLPLSSSAPERRLFPAEKDLRDWLRSLRQAHHAVLVDGGPAEEAGPRWAPVADVGILVCDARERRPRDWARAWDRLEEGGIHVLGAVENRAG